MAKHVCYFSKTDKNSQVLVEHLSKTPFFHEFKYFCVDPLPSTGKRPTLPGYVKAVPMLVIADLDKPLVNAEIQNWISERLLRESGTSGFDDGNGFGGVLTLGDPSYSPLSEVSNGTLTAPAPPITNRLEGTMVSFNDPTFGSMTSPDAPLSTSEVTGAGGVSKGIKPISEKAQEMQNRMDALVQERNSLNAPRPFQQHTPSPPQQPQQRQQMMTPQQQHQMMLQQQRQQHQMMTPQQQHQMMLQQQRQQQIMQQQQQQQQMMQGRRF